jgi:hypothetical protein
VGATRKGGRTRKDKRGVGRGMALTAFVLIVGLVLGGVGGIKFADQPVVLRILNKPKMAPTVKTVTKETTPASCVTAIDTLAGAVASLAGSRQQLMQGDVARASGDQTTAAKAYSEVDAALRTVEVETTNDPLRVAVDDCKSKAAGAATPSPTGTVPAMPTQSSTSSPPSQ